jgi:hypothetical protein
VFRTFTHIKTKKGKPREVTSKLKKLISKKNVDKVAELDNTLKTMQHKAGLTGKSLAGEKDKFEKTLIPTVKRKDVVNDEEMNELADSMLNH